MRLNQQIANGLFSHIVLRRQNILRLFFCLSHKFRDAGRATEFICPVADDPGTLFVGFGASDWAHLFRCPRSEVVTPLENENSDPKEADRRWQQYPPVNKSPRVIEIVSCSSASTTSDGIEMLCWSNEAYRQMRCVMSPMSRKPIVTEISRCDMGP